MRFVRRLRRPGQAAIANNDTLPAPVKRRVSLIIHNPVVKSVSGRKLNEVLNWNDPEDLARRYIDDVTHASHGYANYEVVEKVEVDGFPIKEDGFVYDVESYLFRWRSGTGFHQPDRVDYYRLLKEFGLVPKVNLDKIDEVWLFACPYAGYYESIMAGPGAFWCNAPPLDDRIGRCRRRFVIMGFNYERGVGEMLENLGHRAESILAHLYRRKQGEANVWQRFTRYEKTHPGQAACGTVHFAPNGERDYDWGNARWVTSSCDDWLQFPHLQGRVRQVNCREWGNGDIRQYHHWWLSHMPHASGAAGGIANNWWQYIVDPTLDV
jgi:hypothetical protein